MNANCPQCGRPIQAGELTWPAEAGDVCQDCWETNCSVEWWRHMKALAELGLLTGETSPA